MELLALDKDFQIVDMIVPTNVQWNSKYYECGNFSISLPAEQYFSEIKYIYTHEREEVGEVNKVQYTYTNRGKQIQLSGFFMEKTLDDKVTYPTFNGSGEITSVAIQMLNTYKEDLPINTIQSDVTGEVIELQSTGEELNKKLFELLKTQEMSYKVTYDFENRKMNLTIYRGVDRTQSQSENNFITFSTKFDNLIDVNAIVDNSAFKNYAVIGGSGEGKDRIYETLDLSNGGYKKKKFIDAKDLAYDSEKQTLAQYKLSLQQRALEKMLEHRIVENFLFKPKGNSYEYLVDYKKGDKCDILLEDIGVELESRIINVFEVFKDNQRIIELEFGNTKVKGVIV